MKTVNSLKLSLLAVAGSLGLAVAAVAQTETVEAAAGARAASLLGVKYTSVTAGVVDLDDSGVDLYNFSFGVNENVRQGLDATFDYDFTRSERFLGSHLAQHTLMVGSRAYTECAGLRPFVEASVGWLWRKHGVESESSFAWRGGAGVEIDVAPAVTLTPFVRYTEQTSGKNEGLWDYGVSANYRVNERWSVLATALTDDQGDVGGRLGATFRY